MLQGLREREMELTPRNVLSQGAEQTCSACQTCAMPSSDKALVPLGVRQALQDPIRVSTKQTKQNEAGGKKKSGAENEHIP